MEGSEAIKIESKENLKQVNLLFNQKILNEIIDEKYKEHIDDWLYSALPNEKKGLFILSKVHKHKGQKFFKTQIRKAEEEINSLENLTLKEAYRRVRQRSAMKTTTYGEFYGANVDQKYKFDNIFTNKDFAKVNFKKYY